MNMMKCKNCNNSIPQESTFCPFCGEKIEIKKNEKTCTHCNNSTPLDSKFCSFCGTRLNPQMETIMQSQSNSQHQSSAQTVSAHQHFDFINLNSQHKENAIKNSKHVKISDNEKVIFIGDICKKFASIFFLICTVLYYVACSFIFYFTHTITEEISWIKWGNMKLKHSDLHYYFLGFIRYKTNDYYFWWSVVVIIIICLLLALVPYLIFRYRKNLILQNELVLTDQHIYYYSPHESKPIIIPLINIKAIESTSCTWFYGANRIIISLNNGNTYKIPGLSNAQDFIQAVMKSSLDITTDQKENKDI